MPAAIGAAVSAVAGSVAGAVSGAVYTGLTGIGVSAATASAVSGYAASISALAVAAGAYVGPSLLFRPNIPTPENLRTPRKQPIPDRVSGYGRTRLSGPYLLYEINGTNEGLALNVFALHDGLVDGWERIFLNDDQVTVLGSTYVQVGAGLRYGKFSDLVRIETRLGMPTETNYGAITDLRPDLWPANARGDGIATLMMIAKAKFTENFRRDYPNGLPAPSAEGRLQLCWDARLGSRGTINSDADKLASATWQWTQNPIWHLLDYMTNPVTGMGLPLRRFLPNIAQWSAAASVCDEVVEGRTRYKAGGAYLHTSAPADVIGSLLATFDGWMAEDSQGCFAVQAGKYYAPTVTIEERHIIAFSRQYWREDEQAVNEIVATFTDPSADYTETDAEPFRDEEDIAARGGQVRSQRLPLTWVQDREQARALSKIALSKVSAPLRGTVTTTLHGLNAWDQRRIRIKAPSEGASVADIVVDILPPTLNPDMTVTIGFVQCDPTAYGEPAENPVDTTPRPGPVDLPVPLVLDYGVSTDGGTPRLVITLDDEGLDGYGYVIYWTVPGGAEVREAVRGVAFGGDIIVTSGPLPVSQSVTFTISTVSPSGGESVEAGPYTVTTNPQAARRPSSRSVLYPLSSDDDSVFIEAFTAYMPDGSSISIPAGTIDGLANGTRYGVFWRESGEFEAEGDPASTHFSTGSWIFLGWQATSTGGVFPTPPDPPPGNGGDGTVPIEVAPSP